VGGPNLDKRIRVGALLLGGKTRAELSASASQADNAAASKGTSPRIRVVRLLPPGDTPDAESGLASAAG
jgi:hypothetical protein